MRDKSVRHDFHKLGMEKEMSLSPRVRRCPKAGFRKKHAKLAPCKAALEPVWQIALSSRQQALGPSLAEFADSFGDTSKPCFGCFGSLTSDGTLIPVEVLPLSWIIARNLISPPP